MRFATRTFLWSFIPFVLLLTGSFWAIQTKVVSTVRDGLRSSLREKQVSIAHLHAKSELQNSRFLRIVGENPALKAGLQLLLADSKSGDARLTVEDQLREICELLKFDFLLVSNLDGAAMAGVMRVGDQLLAMDVAHTPPPRRGFFTVAARTYQITSIPIDQGEEHIATLSVGERFDFSEFSTPAVLAQNGKVMMSNIAGVSPQEIEAALTACPKEAECEMRLGGDTFLSMPVDSIYFGDGYFLRSLQSVDRATAPVQAILRGVFLIAGGGAVLAALILSILCSRSIVGPISKVVAHLKHSEKTGSLPEFSTQLAPILEIRTLTDSFNQAAAAIREGHERLHRAYVEFVGSLASALDARDRYTAGHSRRVSEFSCAIASAMNISGQALEELRVAALLHDIGKIGIIDSVLQKPGRLTPEEFALIKQHPTIGKTILEGVHGFESYLSVVELHHENWDGSGYPRGFRGENTPLPARIVHVADVYDAVTSDRPYRSGMSHEDAVQLICECSGTHFDPAIVEIFRALPAIGQRRVSAAYSEEISQSIQNLAGVLGGPLLIPEDIQKESL